jgi:Fe-S cluster biogenesis protein NfuA
MMMTDETNDTSYSKDELMNGLISQISAYIEQYHGGSVELLSFNGETATVKLGGACVGCPLSAATLKGWVEGTVHQFFPDVKVVGVED